MTRRGRHRRPRRRPLLLAVASLALAVGVLGLVRVAPEPPPGGPVTAQAESRPGRAATAERPPHESAPGVGTIPTDPAATSAQGLADGARVPAATSGAPVGPAAGRESIPAPGTIPRADPSGTASDTSTSPTAPSQSPTTAPSSPHRPAPAPSRTTAAPAPAPSPRPSRPGGVCVPIIGLCIDAPLPGRR
ncbi:hypothetical protein ACFC09_06160 [Streptomyces sp. NPDC056161]|uniref:hypothetical protein n=1 Tax=Streptomyces sp. NPDC056161 TaxID=3345732 RepID=UPI0035D750C9